MAIAGFSLLNIGILAFIKKHSQEEIISKLQNVMQQQYYLLQRLGKNLLPVINKGNQEAVRIHLRAVEDLLFSLAKYNLAIPLNLNFVSFSMPQQIIGSNGNNNTSNLAPDEGYYLQATETPWRLIFSKPYIKVEMPEYWFCNLGMGLLQNDIYYGQLDAKMALDTVQEYLHHNLSKQSNILSFKLGHSSITHIKFKTNLINYIQTFLQYLLCELIVFMILISAIIYVLRKRQDHSKIQTILISCKQQLAELRLQSNLERAAFDVQYRYGTLSPEESTIDVQKLLTDIQAVNAPLAMMRQVHIVFLTPNDIVLQFKGSALRLMQILSSMLHEIILQLVANCSVSLQLLVTDVQQGIQLLQFKFSDDGFYSVLQDRQQSISNADISSQGWNNIYRLIELEDGTLEYQHTAYGGNVITFSILRQIVSNVVNIEAYYTKQSIS